jgi:iron(III) transport system permease protein
MVAETFSWIFPQRRPIDFDPMPTIMLAVVIAFSIAIVVQLAVVIWLSLVNGAPGFVESYGTNNYTDVFLDGFTVTVMVNTLGFCFSSLVFSLLFGVPIAWLAERTDLPGKSLVFTLMAVGLILPGFSLAMGWMFLLNPQVGLINAWLMQLFDLSVAPFAITSVLGMGWVQGLSLSPIAFIMTAAVFRAMDPALEEAAHMSGASFASTWLRVTMRLVWPGILAASIFIFTIGFAAFDVPAIIGLGSRIFTFSTYVILLLNPQNDLPRYGAVAALSTIVMALAGGLSWWYSTVQQRARRYAVVSGKGYRPRIRELGTFKWVAWSLVGAYFVLAKLLPVLVLIWASLLPYLQPPSVAALLSVSLDNFVQQDWTLIVKAATNTAILMVLTPTCTILVSLAFSWVVLRSSIRWRAVFDLIAFLPHAIPNVIFGIAALLVALFVLDKVVPIYGTIWMLLVVFVIARLSYGTRMTNSGLIQINRELDECAEVCGAKTWDIIRSVLVPLLSATILYTWMWVALLVYRELTLAVLLTSVDNVTLPIVIWGTWQGGSSGVAAALSLLMLIGMVPLIFVYWFVMRRARITGGA